MEKDEGKKSRNKSSADKITLEHFVSTMAPLIDMEETGLLGKSLLEFHSNKGDVLPPHKADLGSPPLGQGVVYRIKDHLLRLLLMTSQKRV
ncbi:uncharacterized protein [Primulina huaijiensis]|uniref:uncharacterized protein isoform X3 n=1 Tax=Primulina huaijiensis TaxID=1492673 RepID=UPI003CC72485